MNPATPELSSSASTSDTRRNDIFISYSRKDKEFVQTLDTAFRALNRDPWIDWDDIHPSEDWWQAIAVGIEAADTFIFIISPDSISSKVCRQEVDHATQHNKRLVPIVRREGFAMQDVHPSLSRHNWLFFRETDDFDTAFHRLIQTLDTDLEHVKAHTRLLIRAIEWDKKNRNDSFLLRGADLEEGERWLAQSTGMQPLPTDLQSEYLRFSRYAEVTRQKAEARRQRIFTVGVSIFACLALLAAIDSFRQRQVAEQRRRIAEQQEQVAKQLSDRNKQLAEDNIRLLNEPREYEKVLQSRISLLETKIAEAAREGKSALALQQEVKLTEQPQTPGQQQIQELALTTLREWLLAKPEIFAPPFNRQRLEQLTTGTRQQQAKLSIEWLKVNNAYYRYGTPKIGSVRQFSLDNGKLVLEVPITEVVKYHDNAKNRVVDQSSSGIYRFIYQQEGGRWKIVDSQKVQ